MSVLKHAAEVAEMGQLHNCGFTRDFLFLKCRFLFSAFIFPVVKCHPGSLGVWSPLSEQHGEHGRRGDCSD